MYKHKDILKVFNTVICDMNFKPAYLSSLNTAQTWYSWTKVLNGQKSDTYWQFWLVCATPAMQENSKSVVVCAVAVHNCFMASE